MVLQFILFLLPVLMQTWLAALLIGRRLYRHFPLFFAYTSFSLAAELLRTLVQHDQWRFLYVYWTTEALYALLGFLAIYEAFRHVFRHFYVMWWWFRFLPAVIGLLLMGVSLVEGIFFPPIQAPPLLATIFVSEMAVRCLQSGVFCLFIVLVKLYSLPWRNYSFGIALGFAVSAFGIFVTFLVRSKSGTQFVPVIRFIPPVAYIIAVLIWLLSFIKPEPPDPFAGIESPLRPEEVLVLLKSWTQQIKGMFKRCLTTSLY
jgi:hypothetical protein